jgi:hypothetical protein
MSSAYIQSCLNDPHQLMAALPYNIGPIATAIGTSLGGIALPAGIGVKQIAEIFE